MPTFNSFEISLFYLLRALRLTRSGSRCDTIVFDLLVVISASGEAKAMAASVMEDADTITMLSYAKEKTNI